MSEADRQTDNQFHPPTMVEDLLAGYAVGECDFRKADLPEGSDLRGAILAGADFCHSWVSGRDFRDADLRGVCFDGSNVKVFDFPNGDLRGASFRDCTLCGVGLKATID